MGELDFSRSNLRGLSFVKSQMPKADFHQSDLSGCAFERADLSFANLEQANLKGASLMKARLDGANLRQANAEGANFSFSSLRGADLSQARLLSANLFAADLEEAVLEGATIDTPSIRQSEWDLNAVSLWERRGGRILGRKKASEKIQEKSRFLLEKLSLLMREASAQGGYLSERDAESLRPSDLEALLNTSILQDVGVGMYKLACFPSLPHDELLLLWLKSNKEGVFSHQTSLFLHDLSDLLPRYIYMTLPHANHLPALKRGLLEEKNTRFFFDDIDAEDRVWMHSFPVTKPARAIVESFFAHEDPKLIRQAVQQGIRRSLFGREEIVYLFHTWKSSHQKNQIDKDILYDILF